MGAELKAAQATVNEMEAELATIASEVAHGDGPKGKPDPKKIAEQLRAFQEVSGAEQQQTLAAAIQVMEGLWKEAEEAKQGGEPAGEVPNDHEDRHVRRVYEFLRERSKAARAKQRAKNALAMCGSTSSVRLTPAATTAPRTTMPSARGCGSSSTSSRNHPWPLRKLEAQGDQPPP